MSFRQPGSPPTNISTKQAGAGHGDTPTVNMADVENPDPDIVATAEPDEKSTCGLLLCVTMTVLALAGFLVYLTTALQGTSKALIAGLAAWILLLGTCLCAGAVATCIYGNTDGEQQGEVPLQPIEAP
ncbi:hypothetical protein ACQ4PT_000194 [Festuca glaucescens]